MARPREVVMVSVPTWWAVENGQTASITEEPTLVNPDAIAWLDPISVTIPRRSRTKDANGVITDVTPGPVVTSVYGPGLRLRDHRNYILGRPHEVVGALWGPSPCPPALNLGYAVHVSIGHYTLQGECEAVTITAGEEDHYLDPQRLVGDDWTIIRAPDGSANHRFRIRVIGDPKFILQRYTPPPSEGSAGTWTDITATTGSYQAGGRFRIKPKPEPTTPPPSGD